MSIKKLKKRSDRLKSTTQQQKWSHLWFPVKFVLYKNLLTPQLPRFCPGLCLMELGEELSQWETRLRDFIEMERIHANQQITEHKV